jgi:PAS domain S-box-containing protein
MGETPERERLVRELRDLGFDASAVPTAAAAASTAARLLPDAVVLASSLDPMDRWHAMKRLHDQVETREIPTVALAATEGSAVLALRIREALTRGFRSQPAEVVEDDINLAPTDLPAPIRSRAPSGPPQSTRIGRPAAPDPQDTGRILVVDDDEINRDLLSRRLQRKGYQVGLASGGEQALAMLGEHDLVMLDWMMPGMSGLEVLRRAREQWSRIELPIIMCTARSESKDVVEALGLGANDFVTKPLNFDVVHARVRTQLGVAQLHRALRSSEERYRALIENTGDMIVQHRLDGRITYVSPACRALLGYEPAEMLSKPMTHWMHGLDRHALEAQYAAWNGHPPAYTYVARWHRKDQVFAWIETSCRLAVVGAEPMIHAACRDVTEHMSRLPGDEPPLPLGGDIMAHPGWRAG